MKKHGVSVIFLEMVWTDQALLLSCYEERKVLEPLEDIMDPGNRTGKVVKVRSQSNHAQTLQ
jgi:hypothetical protein